ncbi:MAG: 2TM domain-containing protein [Phaeodactylibacter sp.]|nr:2TM domain-containing protein [Phaeodactylibacter sp.]MCB9304455.1 2TM domain-containing protein [Lewinellaceae bacterium]
MNEQEILNQAKKRVKAKKGFFGHLSAFIAVGAFFLAMNLLTYDPKDPTIWFFFPMLPWGIGLLIHYFAIFGLPGNRALSQKWEEEELAREMDRLRRKHQGRLDAPQEETEVLNLEELEKEKEKRSNWSEEDLV